VVTSEEDTITISTEVFSLILMIRSHFHQHVHFFRLLKEKKIRGPSPFLSHLVYKISLTKRYLQIHEGLFFEGIDQVNYELFPFVNLFRRSKIVNELSNRIILAD